jgi:hypothetical protein
MRISIVTGMRMKVAICNMRTVTQFFPSVSDLVGKKNTKTDYSVKTQKEREFMKTDEYKA